MHCSICPTELTGQATKYCSDRCRNTGFSRARQADGRLREYRQRTRVRSANYHRARSAGMTGLVTVPCTVCGGPTGKVAASEAGRRRVCGTICRAYLQNGAWPSCRVQRPQLVEHTCGWCDQRFMSVQPNAWYCSHRCQRRARELRRRVREAGSFGEWRWSDFMRVARRFGYCCAYCGEKPDRLDPDHVTALSRGGLNVIGNLLPTCYLCNSDKRDLTLDEWATDRQRRQLPPRTTTWAAEDNRYWHLTAVDMRVAV